MAVAGFVDQLNLVLCCKGVSCYLWSSCIQNFLAKGVSWRGWIYKEDLPHETFVVDLLCRSEMRASQYKPTRVGGNDAAPSDGYRQSFLRRKNRDAIRTTRIESSNNFCLPQDFKQSGSYFYYYLLRTYFRTAVWKRVSSRKVITKQRECKSDVISCNPILRASLKQLVVIAADLW